jgi:hypothetical protein
MDHRKRSPYASWVTSSSQTNPRFRGGLKLDLGLHLGDSNRISFWPPSRFGCPCWSPWPPCSSPSMVMTSSSLTLPRTLPHISPYPSLQASLGLNPLEWCSSGVALSPWCVDVMRGREPPFIARVEGGLWKMLPPLIEGTKPTSNRCQDALNLAGDLCDRLCKSVRGGPPKMGLRCARQGAAAPRVQLHLIGVILAQSSFYRPPGLHGPFL